MDSRRRSTTSACGRKHTLAGGWGAQALQESSDEAAQTPGIGMNELGNAVLAWQQFDPAAGTRIYIRHYGSGR